MTYLAHSNGLHRMVDESGLMLKHWIDAVGVHGLQLFDRADFGGIVAHWAGGIHLGIFDNTHDGFGL
jgi:hypothetical protein